MIAIAMAAIHLASPSLCLVLHGIASVLAGIHAFLTRSGLAASKAFLRYWTAAPMSGTGECRYTSLVRAADSRNAREFVDLATMLVLTTRSETSLSEATLEHLV